MVLENGERRGANSCVTVEAAEVAVEVVVVLLPLPLLLLVTLQLSSPCETVTMQPTLPQMGTSKRAQAHQGSLCS